MGLEQCSLDTGLGTLGFSKSLIFHWFYELFLELVHYGFGALSCRALKMLLFCDDEGTAGSEARRRSRGWMLKTCGSEHMRAICI